MLTWIPLIFAHALENDDGRSAQLLALEQIFATVERSNDILAAWCQPLPSDLNLMANDLPKVLETRLPQPIPSAYYYYQDVPVDDVLLFPCKESNVIPELAIIRETVFFCPKHGNSENSIHSVVDSLILTPMSLIAKRMGCILRINRCVMDISDSTLRNLQPDVLVWLPSGMLAFKGEEMTKETDLPMAMDELLEKMGNLSKASLVRVPFQICYALGGDSLQFMAIDHSPSGQLTLMQISPVIDLSSVVGRSLCIRYTVNITRVLVWLQKKYPERMKMDKQVFRKETGNSVVMIFEECVIKKTKAFTSEGVLRDLYNEIEQCKPPYLVSLKKMPRIQKGLLTLYLSPVGRFEKRPATIQEIKHAGRCILFALSWLHSKGWVHRDIRVPNTMFANNEWYLADLEWANKIDSVLGNYYPKEYYLPPELVGVEQGIWTASCDMWQFGKLLQQWGLSDQASRNYISTQSSAMPTNRLSASASLSHQFFA